MDIQTTYEWLQLYETNKVNIEDLSRELNLSKRQVYCIIKRYKQSGILGLYHLGKHKPSNHHIDYSAKEQIMSLIRDKYYDCGASYASELLEE